MTRWARILLGASMLSVARCDPELTRHTFLPPKSDLEESGLVGPVRAVVEEGSELKLVDGIWVEHPDDGWSRTEFDRWGNAVRSVYADKGKIAGKVFAKVDSNGRKLLEKTGETGYGHTSEKSYTYDRAGRLVSMSEHGVTEHYTYDLDGAIVRVEREGAGDSDAREYRYAYDTRGNRISEVSEYEYWTTIEQRFEYDGCGRLVRDYFAPDGSFETTYSYDAHGNCVERRDRHQDDDGRPSKPTRRRCAYVYDSRGNWVERITHDDDMGGQPYHAVDRRKIEYFDERR